MVEIDVLHWVGRLYYIVNVELLPWLPRRTWVMDELHVREMDVVNDTVPNAVMMITVRNRVLPLLRHYNGWVRIPSLVQTVKIQSRRMADVII